MVVILVILSGVSSLLSQRRTLHGAGWQSMGVLVSGILLLFAVTSAAACTRGCGLL